jgi:hypothetical protein
MRESRITGAELRYFGNCRGKISRDRIIYGQIIATLHQEPPHPVFFGL